MTRKHFVELARCLHNTKPKLGDFKSSAAYSAAYNMWADSVSGISAVCQLSNPLFDNLRFLAACVDGA
jgi:hypothetical protein